MDAFYEKYPVLKWDTDKNMLKDFPEAAFLAFKMAIDIPQYIEILQQTIADMGAYDGYQIKQLIDEALNEPEVATILNGLGGDVIFSLYGFADSPMSLPLLGLSFTVKSEADFQKLLALLPPGISKNKGDHYQLDLGLAASYIAYKDNRVFVTADEKSMTTFLSGGNSKNIGTNTAIGAAIANSPSLFYLNLNLDDYPKDIRDLLRLSRLDKDAMAAIGLFKDFSAYMNSKYNMQMSLKFKSSKDNPLKQLVKLIDSI
jgi:hypothetical protein